MAEVMPFLATAVPAIVIYLVLVDRRLRRTLQDENDILRKDNLELRQQVANLQGTVTALERQVDDEIKRRLRP